MKSKGTTLLLIMVLLALLPFTAMADKPIKTDSEGNEVAWDESITSCTRIKDGTLLTSTDVIIPMGYDEWGYNYQAHMFNGMWCDYHPVYRPGGANYDWCQENFGDVELMMKWSDEWLANTDCNGDLLLDRGYSCDPINANSSACEGAWLTNHERGPCVDAEGNTLTYEYFVKIVVAPEGAYAEDGIWYNVDDVEIGPVIWGAYAIIQEVWNDPCEGVHGLYYSSPDHPGLGGW